MKRRAELMNNQQQSPSRIYDRVIVVGNYESENATVHEISLSLTDA